MRAAARHLREALDAPCAALGGHVAEGADDGVIRLDYLQRLPRDLRQVRGDAPLKRKIKAVQNGLRQTANVRVHADVPRWAFLQGLVARGDRRVAEILMLAHQNRGNWPRTFKASPINPHFYVHRERSPDERFPWDFIDHGIDKSYLRDEYRRALAGRRSPPCPADPSRCSLCGVWYLRRRM